LHPYNEAAAAAAAEFTGTDEQSAAAVKIQAIQRGKADRARVESLKADAVGPGRSSSPRHGLQIKSIDKGLSCMVTWRA
jgi:hypothetical protein